MQKNISLYADSEGPDQTAHSEQDLRSPFTEQSDTEIRTGLQQKPRFHCAGAHYNLGLRCSRMFGVNFSSGVFLVL